MSNDAELSIGINDSDWTPVLAKMSAQVREFGNSVGAEAKKIDRAVASVTGSMARLGAAGTKVASPTSGFSAQSKQIALATSKLKEYQATMARLSNASTVTTTANGRLRGANGRIISQADVDAYRSAEQSADRYSQALNRMAVSQFQADNAASTFRSTTRTMSADLVKLREQSEGLSRDTKDMAKVYSGMFGSVSHVNGKAIWPPELFQGPKQFTQGMMDMSNAVRYTMYDISRATALAGLGLTALGVGAVVVAAKWERAFADVERTVQGTPETLERIREGLIGLSQDIPVAFADLTQIASVAGQMGISSKGVVAFTETIAKLTATTNLTADAASTALGRFKSFFSEADDPSLAVTEKNFSNLASSILKVGVNSVATESGIVNVATQISSMGRYAGFTADQTIGLAGALSSVGVPPELSRGVITRLFNTISEAVSEGGVRLEDFANIAGTSSSDFESAWGTDRFAYVFTDLIAGLGQLDDGVSVLHELGITSVRDVPVLLRLADAAGEVGVAGSLLAQTMNDARSGWRQNTELTIQYNKIADTLAERTKVLVQNFEALFAEIGSGAVGPVKDLINGVIQLVKGFTMIANEPTAQALGAVAIAAAVLTGGILLLASAATRTFGLMQGLASVISTLGVSAGAASATVRSLGIALGLLTGLGAVLAIAGSMFAMSAASKDAYNAITDTSGALAAMKEDAASGGGFAFTDGLKDARESAATLSTQVDNLGGALSETEDMLYGNATAAEVAGSAVEYAALRYDKASAEMARAAVAGSKAFTDLFEGDTGTLLADRLVAGGFDLDKALELAARDGEVAVQKYLTRVLGVKPNANFIDEQLNNILLPTDRLGAQERDLAKQAGDLLAILSTSGGEFSNVAKSAYATGEAFTATGEGIDAATGALAELEVQSEKAIESMASGFASFVDTGSLIGMTQAMQEAYRVLDDSTTEVDEHAEAVAGFEAKWTDAYGGAKFSLEDYMSVFRRAADEQTTFTSNLQALAARGVPNDIIGDLADMGPQAQALVGALISSTDEQLDEYVALYGSTGFDAMVGMAAGQMAAQNIVKTAAKNLGNMQLQTLAADLSAGTPLTDAMRKWNLDAQGNPMTAPVKEPVVPNLSTAQKYGWSVSNPLTASVKPYLLPFDNTHLGPFLSGPGHANGGFTGPGGKFDPAGIVHRGEYVFKQSDVDQSTGRPKDAALMRMLRGGVAPSGPRGGGYAGGGYVNGAGGGLSLREKVLLERLGEISLYLDGQRVSQATSNANSTFSRMGGS